MPSNKIIAFEPEHIEKVQDFTDIYIGSGYYSYQDLEDICRLSVVDNVNCSFLALNNQDEIIGIRLTLAPEVWVDSYKDKITPSKWSVELNQAAYFKSLFIKSEYAGQGIGPLLSQSSIESIKKLNAKAIICHSWIESPGNSSQKYLLKFGFQEVARHNNFWIDVNYTCTRCGVGKCLCTASEMIKYI